MCGNPSKIGHRNDRISTCNRVFSTYTMSLSAIPDQITFPGSCPIVKLMSAPSLSCKKRSTRSALSESEATVQRMRVRSSAGVTATSRTSHQGYIVHASQRDRYSLEPCER